MFIETVLLSTHNIEEVLLSTHSIYVLAKAFVLDAQKTCLIETIHLSTHKIGFG